MRGLPKAHGLLPHFIRKQGDHYEIAPGTEYSSVDTSLYYHSMLLAARMLGHQSESDELVEAIQDIDFRQLHDARGFILHGLRDDGQTALTSVWADWGGETALVLLLQAMATRGRSEPRMNRDGQVFGGVGFIGEIQSLFYPHFSQRRPDAVSGVDWSNARRLLFLKQRRYFPAESAARRKGVFGLSAGEAWRGEGYIANGADHANVQLIHPHYTLMSWEQWRRPDDLFGVLQRMERAGLFPPMGLVENVTVELDEYLPFIGALNAGLETLAAYHLWAASSGQRDEIYESASRCPLTRDAIRLFFP
jgi:hypothetical protein